MPVLNIITIGDTGTGGWWYAIDDQQIFGDGFVTEGEAIAAAKAAAGSDAYEIWYHTEANGKAVMVPGERSANHPDIQEGK
jgi:hypothetical protein